MMAYIYPFDSIQYYRCWITIKIVRHGHELYFLFHSFIYVYSRTRHLSYSKENQFYSLEKVSHCSAKPHCHTATPRQTRSNKLSLVSSILPSSISSFWLAMHIDTHKTCYILHLTCYVTTLLLWINAWRVKVVVSLCERSAKN